MNIFHLVRGYGSRILTKAKAARDPRLVYKKDPETCQHGVEWPGDDEVLALDLSSDEIRQQYPRFSGTCPDCGYTGIYYASYMQYIMGDY